MVKKFYLDTCIWIDLYEDRRGYDNETLATPAFQLIENIIKGGDKIIISNVILKELQEYYSQEVITSMLLPFMNIIERINLKKEQYSEAKLIARERGIPHGDAAHAILCRDNKLMFVTRDNDFRKLQDITPYHKPEALL